MKSRRLLTAVLALALTAIAQLPAHAERQLVIAYAGFLAGDADRTRLVFDFDREIDVKVAFSTEPARMVVELPPTAFRLGRELDAEKSSLVANVSYDHSKLGRSRIILDLDRPIRITRQSVAAIGSSSRRRLTLDLAPSTERDFAALARTAPVETQTVERRVDGERQTLRPLIVLDPGHGGKDGGALGGDKTAEKNVTLTFSLALKTALEATGSFRVSLTRTDDRFMRLSERLAVARSSRAALLISVHADSLRQKRIRGATVYTLSKKASDDVSAELASDQNRSDLQSGLGVPSLDGDAADILFDLMQRETDGRSAVVASKLVGSLRSATRLIGNPNRSADFFVLRSPDVPSVLLELGYLSNAADEKLLTSPEWIEKVAIAVANGLARSFEDQAFAGGR